MKKQEKTGIISKKNFNKKPVNSVRNRKKQEKQEET